MYKQNLNPSLQSVVLVNHLQSEALRRLTLGGRADQQCEIDIATIINSMDTIVALVLMHCVYHPGRGADVYHVLPITKGFGLQNTINMRAAAGIPSLCTSPSRTRGTIRATIRDIGRSDPLLLQYTS